MLRMWAGELEGFPQCSFFTQLLAFPANLRHRGISLRAFAFPPACYLVLASLGAGARELLVILVQPLLGKALYS